MSWQERIVPDPAILVGKPVVKGTRLAVEFIVELLAQGWTEAQILGAFAFNWRGLPDLFRGVGTEWHKDLTTMGFFPLFILLARAYPSPVRTQ